MKKLLSIVLLAGLISCTNKDGKKTFEVSGTVKNTTSTMVYLEENTPNGRPTIMDSSALKDGAFQLKAPAKEESLYQLRLEGKLVPFALLINDADKVSVQADLNNTVQPYTVKGSAATQGLIDFDKTTYELGMQLFAAGSRVDSLMKAKAPDSVINGEYQSVEKLAAELKDYARNFLAKSQSPILTLYALSSYQNTTNNLGVKGFTQTETAEIITAAAGKFPEHTALQNVKKNLRSSQAPDFTQPDVNGKPVSLSQFRGQYVLVDFWASWCKPCRQDNPNVVKAYNEFKDKNFTILGVSLDQSRDAWLQAIRQDSLTWTHVSDLQFWNNEAAALYGVQSIPYNVLLDPQGNIIAEDLHGAEIVQTLRRVIK